jgi:hypothetical protein
MSDKNKYLDISSPETAKAWLQGFKAKMRVKNQSDVIDEENPANNKFNITDNFLSMAGCDAVERINYLLAPSKLEDTPFETIESALLRHLEPEERLTVSERANFFSTVQTGIQDIADFVVALRVAARHCKFGELKTVSDPTEELIKMRLISGLQSPDIKVKLLEYMQGKPNATIREMVCFVQNFEQSKKFVFDSTGNHKDVIEVHHEKTKMSHDYRHTSPRSCSFCGGNWHENVQSCPARKSVCKICKKKGHFARTCRQRSAAQQHFQRETTCELDSFDRNADECLFMCCNYVANVLKNIKILGRDIKMQVDTGSDRTIISSKMWKTLGSPTLKRYNGSSEAYDGHKMKVIGELEECCEWNKKLEVVRLLVVESTKEFGLLGRDVLHDDVHHMEHQITDSTSVEPDFLPPIRNVKASILLKPDAKNVFCASRPVPLPLVNKVNLELKRLQRMGVISPCTTGSANASPVVWVKKNDGSLRMCADFKVHVNKKIESESYPLPRIETIFSDMDGAKYFAKVDLKSAYWQIELDEDAKKISVINTSAGLFTMNRLQMGMKNAASIFQRVIEQCICGLPGTIAYQDDIFIFASTEASLRKRLTSVRNKLAEKGFTINTDKSVDFTDNISFLGFRISADGIKPDSRLVSKIMNIESPSTKRELEHFIGVVNFFGRFIPNFSQKLLVLNQLKKKNSEFLWTKECEVSFIAIKTELSTFPVVQPYSLGEEATVTTDASQETIAGCLTQNGHPVIFVSRNLTPAEKNYPNVEREALAVVWTVERLRHFLLGRRFTLRTDHQPLTTLFGEEYHVPRVASARIMNWSLRLMPYDYVLQYVPGSDIPHVDGLSRSRFSDNNINAEDEALNVVINSVAFEKTLVNIKEVKHEYSIDPFLQRLKRRVTDGNWKSCSQLEKQFAKQIDSLTVEDDVVYHGTRIMIPASLRQRVMDSAHETHGGINSTLRRLQLSAWWPGMSSDVNHFVSRCQLCNTTRPHLAKTTDLWPECPPFERWHIDWAWCKDRYIFIMVDAGSGWVEAFESRLRTSEMVIKFLRTVFTRFGMPRCLVSDNATEFVAHEITNWIKNQGVCKVESPPYNPRSNGLAERGVKTIKDAMKTYNASKHEFTPWLQKILLHHRCTAVSRGKSPAEILFGKKLRLPVVSNFEMGETVGYKAHQDEEVRPMTYLMTKGRNTAYIVNEADRLILASTNQLAPLPVNDVTPVVPSDIIDPTSVSNTDEMTREIISSPRRSGRLRRQPDWFVPDQ